MSIKAQSYLYPTADGVWMFQIFIPVYMRHIFGGKRLYRKSTGTRDLTAAKHFRNHMLIEWKTLKEQYSPDTEERRIQHAIAGLHKQATLRAPLQTVPTLTTIRDQYADKYRDKRSFSTLAKSARAVEVFLASLDRVDVKITEIRRSQVTMFINQQGKKAPQTVQNWLTCLGSLYEYARRSHDDIAPDNPFHGMNLEARATIESYQPFDPDQMQKLLDSAEPEIRNIITMGLFSGCRLDELASLKKSEIQTVEGVRCFYISKSKTKAGIRHVPIHSRLSEIVDDYLSHAYGEYLFPQANRINRKDGKKGPFYSQAFTRLRRRVLPTATDRQCFHSLRGMFITCLDRAGVPEQRIGAITGHTDQKSKTEAFRTYSQGASMEELKKHVEIVNFLW
ncbi:MULTISPECIES: site-specific integrase [Enterobacteriaceae]|uniref:site-specific integrase n=1 Tax=Enterobacteriaceae TaxID=543 RepID=UPI00058424B3|nr:MULTISPECIES: site-specific integrase [Enterobacteriaceae]ELA3610223.1 site-specific integrase [Klebsiella variicola]HEO9203204.1 site-specific integrase [Enterobacter hormaechei subsp. xiangfangensis]ELI8992931.1 site-specific integrase [Klebsiella variicola]MDA4592854.1 site-specific integrase [Enterobacter hormaechei]PPX82842.1 integrase [Cronobacter sakazakii]